MQSKSGSKNYGRYISIGITVAIVMMMVLSGPVTAVSLGITELDGTTHTKGNSVTFNVTATIEGTDRYVPIDSFSLGITGATSKDVVFSTDGTILSGSGISVEAVTVPSSSEYGQGNGYGYDSRLGYGYDFGYGYGYGYDNGAGGEDVVYKYTITLDTSTFNAGLHEAVLSLNTGDEVKPSFESSAASFTIEEPSSNVAPVADINGPYSGVVGTSIQFSSSGSTDSDGTIESYYWEFGDGTTSTLENPTNVYSSAGTFTVNLTVTDDDSATNTSSTTVNVDTVSSENIAPIASINGPYSGVVGTSIQFSSSGSTDSDGIIESYYWEFGDGTTSTLENPTNVYSSAGTFTVNLTVTDDGSATNTSSTTVNVDTSSSSSGGSSGGSSSSGGGGGSGSTGEAFENIAFKAVKTKSIVGGLKVSYVFDDEQNAIQYINFFAVRNYQRTSTTIEVLKGRSAMVDESAPGLIYQNMNIWVGKSGFATEDNIADPVIGFRVAKDWLAENGIEEDSIGIYRHSEGKWNALNIEKVGEDDSYIYFEAETPGFSPFAIAADVDDGAVTDYTGPTEEDTSTVNITESSGEELNVSGSEEATTGSGLNTLFLAIPMLMVLIVLYASYASLKGKRDDAGDMTADLPDDMQNAESDVSETASDSTNGEEMSGQPAKTIPPVDKVSDQPAETIPAAEEILGYPAETTSPAQENEVRPVDTEQNVKEMKKSRNFSDDGWSTSTTEEISGEPAETTSTAEEYEVQLDDTEQKTEEAKEFKKFSDSKW